MSASQAEARSSCIAASFFCSRSTSIEQSFNSAPTPPTAAVNAAFRLLGLIPQMTIVDTRADALLAARTADSPTAE